MTDTVVACCRPPAAAVEPLLRVVNVVKHFGAGVWRVGEGGRRRQLRHRGRGNGGTRRRSPGCGKSTLGRLITSSSRHPGEVFLDGVDLTKLHGEKLRQQRQQLQMIFQDPYCVAGPAHDVGDIIAEPLGNCPDCSAAAGKARECRNCSAPSA